MKLVVSGVSRFILYSLIVIQLIAVILFIYGTWIWSASSPSSLSSWTNVFHIKIFTSTHSKVSSSNQMKPAFIDNFDASVVKEEAEVYGGRKRNRQSVDIYDHKSNNHSSDYKFKEYSLFNPKIHNVLKSRRDSAAFFVDIKSKVCFKYGTDISRSVATCACKSGWFGEDCGIPDAVYFADPALNSSGISRRHIPRLIIQAFIVNHEYDFFETRLHELYDVVDVFLMLESNYTMYGKPKPLNFYNRLAAGYMRKYQDKIVYIFLDHFPEHGFEDGWVADAYLRNYLGRQGMKRLRGTSPDDLIIYTDADEIPRKETVLFLKLYEGYSEPIGFRYRWSYYGYFWANEETWDAYSITTLAMLRYVYQYDLYRVRKNDYDLNYARVSSYISAGGNLSPWLIGSRSFPAGWHCSWCFTPEGIRTKLISAINADFPRWGDYPEKRNLTYIKWLVKEGRWFDGSKKFNAMFTPKQDQFFAPSHMLNHPAKFRYLLDNLYSDA